MSQEVHFKTTDHSPCSQSAERQKMNVELLIEIVPYANEIHKIKNSLSNLQERKYACQVIFECLHLYTRKSSCIEAYAGNLL